MRVSHCPQGHECHIHRIKSRHRRQALVSPPFLPPVKASYHVQKALLLMTARVCFRLCQLTGSETRVEGVGVEVQASSVLAATMASKMSVAWPSRTSGSRHPVRARTASTAQCGTAQHGTARQRRLINGVESRLMASRGSLSTHTHACRQEENLITWNLLHTYGLVHN